jgi:hypothetical protein
MLNRMLISFPIKTIKKNLNKNTVSAVETVGFVWNVPVPVPALQTAPHASPAHWYESTVGANKSTGEPSIGVNPNRQTWAWTHDQHKKLSNVAPGNNPNVPGNTFELKCS